MIGRKTLKSERARMRRIDLFFERVAHVFLLSYALFLMIAWISYRPSIQIEHIAIEGVHSVDQSAVSVLVTNPLAERILSRINRNNIFFYPSARVLHEISVLDPRISNAKITFNGTHQLHVTLEEFTPALLYCTKSEASSSVSLASSTTPIHGECYFADERGYVFAPAPTWSGYPFLTIIASSTEHSGTSSPLRTFALKESEYAQLKTFFIVLERMNIHPRTITMLGGGDFRISTEHPWDILWASGKDLEVSANNLALMLRSLKEEPTKETNVHIIDLRFGNKIFYK